MGMCVLIIQREGFGVALSTVQGNARASINGKSNGKDSHAFSFNGQY